MIGYQILDLNALVEGHSDFDSLKYDPRQDDVVAFENALRMLSQDELEFLLCRYLGFSVKETIIILNYSSQWKYYKTAARLRNRWAKQKRAVFGI